MAQMSSHQFKGTHPYRLLKEKEMNTHKKTARIAGFLYLSYIIFTAIANVVGRKGIIVEGDAAATAANIIAKGMLFRIGFVSDVFAGVLFLLAAWALFALLKPVNKNIALLFLFVNLGGVTVQCINMLNLYSAALLLNGANYLKVFPAGQLQGLATFFLDVYKNGFMIAQFFFGVWLFPLGYLVFKSGYLPKALGIVLMVECFGWLLYPFQFFLFPSYIEISYLSFAIGFIGEVSLTLWLLIMGAQDQKPTVGEAGGDNRNGTSFFVPQGFA
jgi:hypothetical protein